MVLHNIAANHIDVFVVQKTDNKESVNKNTVHCQLQDQVCTEPGVPAYVHFAPSNNNFFIEYATALQQSLIHSPILSRPLRGPPTFA